MPYEVQGNAFTVDGRRRVSLTVPVTAGTLFEWPGEEYEAQWPLKQARSGQNIGFRVYGGSVYAETFINFSAGDEVNFNPIMPR